MSVDEFDISDEERERRRDEAALTFRLILSVGGTDERPTTAEVDRLLGL